MKISILMQAYLADYPGSRTDPERKFLRAVNSVIAQTTRDWELIIISDGCTITESLYKQHFSHYSNIIFEKINKHAGSDMQQKHDSVKYRIPGSPMARALELATGDWVVYFGSDDFLLRNYIESIVETIKLIDKKDLDIRFLVNKGQIEHSSWDIKEGSGLKVKGGPITIEGLPSLWKVVETTGNTVLTNNTRIIHKRGFPNHSYSDDGDYTVPRDTLFIRKVLRNKDYLKYISSVNLSGYVRCHAKASGGTPGWDF